MTIDLARVTRLLSLSDYAAGSAYPSPLPRPASVFRVGIERA